MNENMKIKYFDDELEVYDERRVVNKNTYSITLNYVPSPTRPFTVENGKTILTETQSSPNANQYVLDRENGLLLFNPAMKGKMMTMNYSAIGMWCISADKIFTNVDNKGKIVETLEDLMRENRQAIESIKAVGDASAVITQLQADIDSVTGLVGNIAEGSSVNEELTQNIESGEGVNATLINTISSANNKINEMNTWVNQHENIVNLDNRVDTVETEIPKINELLEHIKIKHLKINIMDYGAIGDGLTDDSKIIQDVINSTNNDLYQTIEIPQGYVFNIASGVNIVGKKKLLITGGGTLINGTITVQGENDSDKLDITFKNINFEMRYQAEYHPKTISAITLSKCSNINIFDVTFKRYGHVITFKKVGEESHQQISRVNIQRCIFEDIDYCLHNDDTSTSYYLTGDTTFANNNVYGAWQGVLKMSGCDGLLMTGNTVFTPRHSLAGDMINLNKFNYVRIENNQLFESGLCTIKAKNGENLNILNNSIPYGGQNALSSAIDVLDCVMVSIQGNLIERNSNYGINIIKGDNYCSYVNISNNIVREIGVNPHYRGNDLDNSSKTPINVSPGVTRCLVDGNITDKVNAGVYNNGNNLYDDVFQKKLDLDLKADKKTINYFCQINTLGLSGTNTLITFMVNKGVTQIPSFYDDGTNMIVDDNGTARTLNYIRTQTYREDFNLIEYVCNDGDIRDKFTQHKLYQIF